MTLAWSQSMTWLREIAWSVTTDLFCSPASDLLVLRVYALTSRWETSCRCSWSRTPNARPVSPSRWTEQVSSHRSCYLSQPCHRLGSGQSHRQRKQQSGQMDQGGDTYQEGTRQVDEQRRGVLSTLPHLRQHVRPESERRTAIRQTVPKKTLVEVETSTSI